jgi:uncharacterized repeat protein (TIGR03803 family)
MVRLAAACAIALACLAARAQVSEFPLLSFPVHEDGLVPGLTVGPDGTLYGSSVFGRIFSISPSGAGFKILCQTGARLVDYRLLLAWDGALYGTTTDGGTNDDGTVFRINPDGTGYDVICQFGAWLSEWVGGGHSPGLIQARDGALYGAYPYGPPDQEPNQYGFVYRVNPDGSGFKVLHAFPGGASTDGAEPRGLLVQGPDGALYGTTSGGSRFPNSWVNIIGGGMIQGPPGIVFKINPDGTGYRILHGFGDPAIVYPVNDGAWPLAGLTLGRDGALYGTTTIGGDNGAGTLFSIKPDGTGYASLCSFRDQSPPGLLNWIEAQGYNSPSRELLLASDGAFYGVIELGGQWNRGEVFRYDPVATNITEVYSFTTNLWDGEGPLGALVQGLDGALYGTTWGGGLFGGGTVFRLATPELGRAWQAPLFISVAALPGGSVQVQLGGARNCSYRLDGSVNLVDWQPLATFNNTNGLMEWTDLDAVNYPHRFYRAALVP